MKTKTADQLIRRIMQVEIMPEDDNPDECVVWIRNPATDKVVATIYSERTDEWVEGMK